MTGLRVEQCFRCGSDLLFKEIQAQQMYCAKCTAVLKESAENERRANEVNRANRRVK